MSVEKTALTVFYIIVCCIASIIHIVQLVYGLNYKDECDSFMTYTHWLVVNGAVGITTLGCLITFALNGAFTKTETPNSCLVILMYVVLLFYVFFNLAWTITGTVLLANCFDAGPESVRTLVLVSVILQYLGLLTGKRSKNE